MTKDEALRLALEALEFDSFYATGKQEAITAIKASLANEALERKAENARELGLDYEPLEAKDEPVAYMGTDIEGNPNKFRLNSFGGCIPLYAKKTGGAS